MQAVGSRNAIKMQFFKFELANLVQKCCLTCMICHRCIKSCMWHIDWQICAIFSISNFLVVNSSNSIFTVSVITTLVVLLLFTCNSHLTVVMPNHSQLNCWLHYKYLYLYQSPSMTRCFSVSAWFIHLFSSLVSSPVCLRKTHLLQQNQKIILLHLNKFHNDISRLLKIFFRLTCLKNAISQNSVSLQ